MAQPRLPDKQTKDAMLPGRCYENSPFKESIRKILRVNDEQLAVNRYRWYNLPPELSGNLIERILYYRGQAMLFYIPEMEKFYFLPYTLCGNLDIYGRYDAVKPLPFMGEDQIKKANATVALFSSQTREPVYDIDGAIDPETFLQTKCILLNDYSKQLSQIVQPRVTLNEGLIDIESNLIPYLNTMLSNSTGVAGMRVNDADEQASVQEASDTVHNAALNCKRWQAIRGQLEFQDLSVASTSRAEDMLLAMQALDNFRLGTFGLDNGGLFNKKDYQNRAQTAQMGGQSSIVMEDGLYQRQRLCDIINTNVLIPLGFGIDQLWDCQIAECAAGADLNMDGLVGEGNTDAQPTTEQAVAGGETDGNE